MTPRGEEIEQVWISPLEVSEQGDSFYQAKLLCPLHPK
jgi:hypothetical protein